MARPAGAAAPELAAAVGDRLRALAMPGARFEVDGRARRPGEAVRFLLGANPGEPVQPLARVASGGELARAMLALRLVVAWRARPPWCSTRSTPAWAGRRPWPWPAALREVAAERQVLVVTHLAQVAAFADHQVAVRKAVARGRTVTAATCSTPSERVVELSRMLSGHPDSPTARAHAEELLASRPDAASRSTTGSGRRRLAWRVHVLAISPDRR